LTDYPNTSAILDQILVEIQERGEWRGKIKTLMGRFRLEVPQRIHGTSWQRVKESLSNRGIAIKLVSSGGESANDYVKLTWPGPNPEAEPALAAAERDQPQTLKRFEPLPFLFNCSDSLDETDSPRTASDILNAVWTSHTVCLIVDAPSDDCFAFLCAFFSAILRRRGEMIRRSSVGEFSVPGLEIIGKDRLRRFLLPNSGGDSQTWPARGAVYFIRRAPDDSELDELAADVRDSVLPHLYQLALKPEFIQTSATDEPQGATSVQGWENMQRWFSSFASVQDLKSPGRDHGAVDIARMLVETIQLRDSLQGHQAHAEADPSFVASASESTEHMVLKSAVIHGLRNWYPSDEIVVEQLVWRDNDNDSREEFVDDQRRGDKPDIRISNRIWVEIETLRGISSCGSDPFLSLEAKLRQKTEGMKKVDEVWLLVPSDIAALATNQVTSIARNLNFALGANKVRPGFVDMVSGTPVFFEIEEMPAPQSSFQLRGTPRQHPTAEPHQVNLGNIAGYSDLKKRIEDDILAPLTEAAKYRRHGQLNASGLLLYGLPGCGKSLMGQAIAGETGRRHRSLVPSDLTSMWLGESVAKTRELFDWALKHSPCVLIIDELDAIASQRSEANMHTSEKRQVNELLTQLDRISNKGVVVVATTNYLRGIDTAIQRSGRFDLKVPVFPPTKEDRADIFKYYLKYPQLKEFPGITDSADSDIKELIEELAVATPLFSPADIKAVVCSAARQAVRKSAPPALTHQMLRESVRGHNRSIQVDAAQAWLEEVAQEISPDQPEIAALQRDIETVRNRATGSVKKKRSWGGALLARLLP
jgi:AAA+ superfamily predicted ATPase